MEVKLLSTFPSASEEVSEIVKVKVYVSPKKSIGSTEFETWEY